MAAEKKYPNELRFDYDAQRIEQRTQEIIDESRKKLDCLAKESDLTWEKTLKVLADEDAVFTTQSSSCYFPSHVHTDKAIRDASTAAAQKLEEYQIEKNFREDIYNIVKEYSKKHNPANFTPEENRFLEKVLESFDRNGLGLPPEKRARLKEVKQQISNLCIEFQQALNEDNTFELFTLEELDGMGEDFIKGLEKDGDKYKVTLKYPHLFPILQKAKNPETRRRLNLAKEKQCMDKNIPILEKVLLLRQEEAELLGFKNHAEYILAIRMAKTPERVLSFLEDLNKKLSPALESDLATLLELKKKESEETGRPYDGKIHAHDWRYYQEILLSTKYQVEEDVIAEYFPLEHVTEAMLHIYQEVLGLKFVKTENPHVWHPDVLQYSVYNASDDAFMGHFYLDLHPREGKYGHAAEFDLQKGCLVGSTRQYPAAAMVANFTKPLADKPSLLKHNEVVTYFHEFGHVMHELMTTANFILFSGTSVQRDFVETPSQMLENWCYEEEVLRTLSKHYKTGEPLPENLRKQLVAAKNVCSGIIYKRQLSFGFFDMTIHTAKGPVDTGVIWRDIRKRIAGIEAPEGTNGAGSFGHLTGGYSAGYYGYLWSEVFSADLFSVFKKQGVLNKELGMKYREKILAPGGTRDAHDLLVDFLGREPNEEAFLVHIGLKSE